MESNTPHYTTSQRLTAIAIGIALALGVAIIAASVAIEFGIRSEYATGMAVQSTIPLVFVFWKWPNIVLKPIAILKRMIRK